MSKKVTKVDLNSLSPGEQAAHFKRANAMLKHALERALRQGVSVELAEMLLASEGYWKHPTVAPLVLEGLLRRPKAFPQKRGPSLQFYGRAFSFMPAPPSRILEIGVKGGASLELWKATFPEAQIVGADIDPRVPVLSEGITVVYADQAKPETIAEVGERFGPFNLVIDDGSHVGKHMINSLVALLPHLAPGALYVIEDILSDAKNVDCRGDDGKIGELVSAGLSYFGRHQKGEWVPPESSIQVEAEHIVPRMATMLLSDGILAFVLKN